MAAIASDKTCAGPCRAAAQGDDGADDRQCAWAATVNTAARAVPPILVSRSARRLGRCHPAE